MPAISPVKALERFEEASTLARFWLHIEPDSPDMLGHLGSALGRLGRHEEAADCFRRALDLPVAPVGVPPVRHSRRQASASGS